MKNVEKVDTRPIEKILAKHTDANESLLIPLLQEAQGEYGYLPQFALERIAEHTKVPLSKVYGVVTFYSQFYLTPRGRHIVKCCRGTACHVRGATRALEAVEKELGIKDGETAPDFSYTLETIACFGTCALSPVMTVDGKYFGKLTPQKVTEILRSQKKKAESRKPRDKPRTEVAGVADSRNARG